MFKYLNKKNILIVVIFIILAIVYVNGTKGGHDKKIEGALTSIAVDPNSNIVSQNGVYLRAHLSVKINGKEIKIPAGIGFLGELDEDGMPKVLHTHSSKGIIRAEMKGVVSKDQLRLGEFFRAWGKDFSKDSILGNKVGEMHKIKMFVNGVENFDYENYIITGKGTYDGGEDGMIDDIQIVYE